MNHTTLYIGAVDLSAYVGHLFFNDTMPNPEWDISLVDVPMAVCLGLMNHCDLPPPLYLIDIPYDIRVLGVPKKVQSSSYLGLSEEGRCVIIHYAMSFSFHLRFLVYPARSAKDV